MSANATLSAEQARQTAAALFACIGGQDNPARLIALAILSELNRPSRGPAPAYPLLETVRVDAGQLQTHFAVNEYFRRRANPGQEITECIEQLRATPFDMTWPCAPKWETNTAPRARPRHADQLLDIIRVREWSDPGDWQDPSISWLVRGGQWAYWNMNSSGRALVCRVANAALRHCDGATLDLTLKVGRFLGFQALERDEGYTDCTVMEVLRSIGELAPAEQRDELWTRTVSARFSTALASLLDVGVLMDAAWPMTYRVLRAKGAGSASPDWLDSRIRVGSPVHAAPRTAGWRYRVADGAGL